MINVDLDGRVFFQQALSGQLNEVAFCKFFYQGFEKFGSDHVKGWAVVVEDGHRFFTSCFQHLSRVLFEFGHADGVVGVDGLNGALFKIRANFRSYFGANS